MSGLSCSMSIDFILGEEIYLLVKVGWRLPLTSYDLIKLSL